MGYAIYQLNNDERYLVQQSFNNQTVSSLTQREFYKSSGFHRQSFDKMNEYHNSPANFGLSDNGNRLTMAVGKREYDNKQQFIDYDGVGYELDGKQLTVRGRRALTLLPPLPKPKEQDETKLMLDDKVIATKGFSERWGDVLKNLATLPNLKDIKRFKLSNTFLTANEMDDELKTVFDEIKKEQLKRYQEPITIISSPPKPKKDKPKKDTTVDNEPSQASNNNDKVQEENAKDSNGVVFSDEMTFD